MGSIFEPTVTPFPPALLTTVMALLEVLSILGPWVLSGSWDLLGSASLALIISKPSFASTDEVVVNQM